MGEQLVGRLTSKGQTTIPKAARMALALKAGDALVFEVEGETLKVKKARPLDVAYLKALESTLSEWSDELDDEAFRDL